MKPEGKTMYKITMECTGGDEYEINPAGEALNFVRVAYTDNAEVAEYYKNKVGIISVKEVKKED